MLRDIFLKMRCDNRLDLATCNVRHERKCYNFPCAFAEMPKGLQFLYDSCLFRFVPSNQFILNFVFCLISSVVVFMEGKRPCIPQGNTPSKPSEKRSRIHDSSSTLFRGELFSCKESPLLQTARVKTLKSKHVISKLNKNWITPVKRSPVKKHNWTYEEDKALVEFVGYAKMDPEFWSGCELISDWPGFRQGHQYWTSAAKHVQLATKSNVLLTKQANKSNIVYKLVRCLATKRPGSEDPLLPLDRMPFGLIQYQIDFFNSTHISQVKLSKDFQSWHETLCAEFPTRFNRLFRGPMWSGLPQDKQRDPLTARVNVAAPSTRTVERHTAASEYSTELDIQIPALKQLKEAHPNGRFWIKGDGCDVKAALQESVLGVWNGDVNLGDGKLGELRKEYDVRREILGVICREDVELEVIEGKLRMLIDILHQDTDFLSKGLKSADDNYRKKYDCPNTSKSVLMDLCWERVEFSTLLQQSQSLKAYLEGLMPYLNPIDPRVLEVARQLAEKKDDLLKYLRNVFVKKRQPGATHVFVFLVSEERRNKKPYCLPVQYIPYHSLKDQYVCDLAGKIKRAMIALGMKPIGFVSDGEFNSLRSQGEHRPVYLWLLIHDARESVSKQSKETLLKILIKTGDDANGNPMTAIHDAAVPKEVVNELHQLRTVQGMTTHAAVTRLRNSLVPAGYDPYPFRPKTFESLLDKLRSLVATYRFRHAVNEYKTKGMDFSTYLYVPEFNQDTGEYFHERDDHCHILKRIWKHTRETGPPGARLEGFDEAMRDSTTGLTQAALTGERKQSVQDAEHMLSYLVAKFLQENGYENEGVYVQTVAGWHEAADGRGLSELQRCKKNYAMLNMILNEWMPWHQENYDFSTIDINRPVKDICGFSRETVVAITTNIESMEFRRCEGSKIGYEEHPRAGTSDDVECFIALLHRFLGLIFTVKELRALWRKIVREFCKRLDDDLPFYYWTLNERYQGTAELPSFNESSVADADVEPCDHPLRLHRLSINRREDSAIFVAGRSFLPARNQTTVRQRIHRPVVEVVPQEDDHV